MPNSVEKTGLKTGIFKLLFIISLIYTSSFAQINLRGFGKAEFKDTAPGNYKIYAYDYSEDGIDDLILFGENKKRVILHPSELTIYPSEPIYKFFFYPVSGIAKMNMAVNNQSHVFISRSKRKGGLFSFTKYGTMQLLNEIEFDSYPENVISEKLYAAAPVSAFVFGPNFKGIQQIIQNDLVLEQQEIISESSYLSVVIKDLNYDGFKDIIGLNMLTNNIDIFYYTDSDGYEFQRSIKNRFHTNFIDLEDINSDGYLDLLSFNDSGLQVFNGDSVSTFKSFTNLDSVYSVSSALVRDINNDGQNDILFYNNQSNVLSSCFFTDFPDNVTLDLHKFQSLSDISHFKNGSNSSYALLDSSGTLTQLSYLTESEKQFSMMLAVEPTTIFISDFLHKGKKDYFVIDAYKNELKSFLSERSNFNSFYFPKYLSDSYQVLTGQKSIKKNINLFAYNPGGFQVESILSNLDSATFNKSFIQVFNKVQDVLVSEYSKELSILEKGDSALFLSNYTNDGKNWTLGSQYSISGNHYFSSIINSNSYLCADIYGDNIKFEIINLSDSMQTGIDKKPHVFPGNRNSKIFLNACPNNTYTSVLSVGTEFIYSYFINHSTLSSSLTVVDIADYKFSNRISAFYHRNEEKEFIFINDQINEKLVGFEREIKSEKFIQSKKIESVVCNSYFATSLFNNNEDYLVYINKNTNTINFLNIND